MIINSYPETPFQPDPALSQFAEEYKGKSVLDYGCGVGRNLPVFIGKAEVYGLDYPNMVKLAEQYLGKDSNKVCWTPNDMQKYDLIFTELVLQHFTTKQVRSTLEYFKQHLKPNGKLLVYGRGYNDDCTHENVWQLILEEFKLADHPVNKRFNPLNQFETHQHALFELKEQS